MNMRGRKDAIMRDAEMSNDGNNLDVPEKEKLSTRWAQNALSLFAQSLHQAETETAFLNLQSSAVNAEPESYTQANRERLAAIAILKRHPELLFRNGMVKDHFGRVIEGSPYRILLGAGDVWALKQVHELIIPKIKNGEDLAKADFQAQFPSCPWPFTQEFSEEQLYDERNKMQIAQVRDQLKIISENVTFKSNELLLKEIAILCQTFMPKEGEVIRTGLHFPLGIMKEIGKIYDDIPYYGSTGESAIFSRTVIGSAQAALTAVDGQCYKYGLGYVKDCGPDRRDGLFCPHPEGIPAWLAPLPEQLGRTMFVDHVTGHTCYTDVFGNFGWYGTGGWHPEHPIASQHCAERFCVELMENKSRNMRNLFCSQPSMTMTYRGYS